MTAILLVTGTVAIVVFEWNHAFAGMTATEKSVSYTHLAPRFLLTDQQGKFALGIGGYLKTTMEYDFNGIVDDLSLIHISIYDNDSVRVDKSDFL